MHRRPQPKEMSVADKVFATVALVVCGLVVALFMAALVYTLIHADDPPDCSRPDGDREMGYCESLQDALDGQIDFEGGRN
jgi:hypothetical protein